MKKTTIIAASIFAIFVFIVSSCASRRQSTESWYRQWQRELQVMNYTDTTFLLQQFAHYTAAGFPLQEIRGYTDSMLVAKYLNVDLESFQPLERVRRIFNMPVVRWENHRLEPIAQMERQLMIARERHRYPRNQIRDVEQAINWLLAVYQNNEASRATLHQQMRRGTPYYEIPFFGWNLKGRLFFAISHYKQVGDGFLVKGQSDLFTDIVLPYCFIWRNYGIFLVGYDHNIVEIKRWRVYNCPNKPSAEINIKIHYPEFEGADVRLPELVGHRLDSLLLANIRYPFSALDDGLQGVAIGSFIVEIDGKVSNLEIVTKTDHPSLNREALRTIQASATHQWIPGIKNGEKIPMEIQIEVEFVVCLGDFWRPTGVVFRNPMPRLEDIPINIMSNRNSCDCISAFD